MQNLKNIQHLGLLSSLLILFLINSCNSNKYNVDINHNELCLDSISINNKYRIIKVLDIKGNLLKHYLIYKSDTFCNISTSEDSNIVVGFFKQHYINNNKSIAEFSLNYYNLSLSGLNAFINHLNRKKIMLKTEEIDLMVNFINNFQLIRLQNINLQNSILKSDSISFKLKLSKENHFLLDSIILKGNFILYFYNNEKLKMIEILENHRTKQQTLNIRFISILPPSQHILSLAIRSRSHLESEQVIRLRRP